MAAIGRRAVLAGAETSAGSADLRRIRIAALTRGLLDDTGRARLVRLADAADAAPRADVWAAACGRLMPRRRKR